MAEGKIEELTDGKMQTSTGGRGGKSINPLVPIVLLLVFLPLLSFVMTEYLLIPRIKLAVEKAITENIGTLNKDGTMAPPKVPESQVLTYEIKEVVANITAPKQNRYVRVSFVLEGADANFVQLMKTNEVRLVDATLSVLSMLTMEELTQPSVKNLVRTQLLQRFETVMRSKVIQNIYFSQFVMQ